MIYRFQIVLISLFIFSPLMASNTYVLSIGINDYANINDLNLCVNDATDFGSFMENNGAIVEYVLNSDATHENIIGRIRKFIATAKPDDTVIFFFSGHGYEGGFCCWEMATNTPSQTNPVISSTILNKDQTNSLNKYYGGISYPELQVLFRSCKSKNKIVIADACFSGGLSKGAFTNTSVQSAKKGDILFFLSSQQNETSLETPNGKNGLFTHFLLNGLSGEADLNNDKKITIGECVSYVSQNVDSYASRLGHSQHPRALGSYNENIPLITLP